jgi:hypothetical protein
MKLKGGVRAFGGYFGVCIEGDASFFSSCVTVFDMSRMIPEDSFGTQAVFCTRYEWFGTNEGCMIQTNV